MKFSNDLGMFHNWTLSSHFQNRKYKASLLTRNFQSTPTSVSIPNRFSLWTKKNMLHYFSALSADIIFATLCVWFCVIRILLETVWRYTFCSVTFLKKPIFKVTYSVWIMPNLIIRQYFGNLLLNGCY